jgi:hypothetical protein
MQDTTNRGGSEPDGWALDGAVHEHAFYAHRDPRWLVCDCGQLAHRTRTAHGQFAIALIDRPSCAFTVRPAPGAGS